VKLPIIRLSIKVDSKSLVKIETAEKIHADKMGLAMTLHL